VSAPAQLPEEARSPWHFHATARDWDAAYDHSTVLGHWWRARLEAAIELIGHGPGSLLEVGVGSGRLLAALADRGWTVTGVDPAPAMVELARARAPVPPDSLVVARAEALPFPAGGFDVAVAIGVLEYADMDAALRELVRALRPGGRAVVGLRRGNAPTIAWHRHVVHPIARAAKRAAPFGRPLSAPRRAPLSVARAREVLSAAGLTVERVENAGAAVLPDPFDHLAPHVAYRAARAAERSARLRRVLGTQRLLVAHRR
jgi:SAM-dependent methyltransferase